MTYDPSEARDEKGQWTDGGGGGLGSTIQANAARQAWIERGVKSGQDRTTATQQMAEVAANHDKLYGQYERNVESQVKALGFPPERVFVHTDNEAAPTIAIGDKVYGSELGGGHYVPLDYYDKYPSADREKLGEPGTVHLFPDSGQLTGTYEGSFSQGVAAHEVMHAKFDAVMTQYTEERHAMMDHDDAATRTIGAGKVVDPGSGEPYHMRADGGVRDEYAAKYPTYAAVQPIFEGRSTWNEKAGKSTTVDGFDAFTKEDGATPYSKEYWTAWNSGKIKNGIQQPINESLAEIAHLDARGQLRGVKSPTYRRFYKAVNEQYAHISRRKSP